MISLLLASCSTNSALDAEKVDGALQKMVIDKTQFDLNYLKPCSDMQQCQLPLVCMHSRCEIPPSLTNSPSADTPRLEFSNGDERQSFYIEERKDQYAQAKGMMFRKAFADGWGMLFIFNEDSRRHFWMKDCYIPLDMVFIRKDGTVSNVIRDAAPIDEKPRYESTDRVRFVLELPSGSIDKYHLSTSTKFDVSQYVK